jgi:hypothetical protein
MTVALARKLLIALWRLVTTGEVPAGVPPCSDLSRHGLETMERTARVERRPTLTAPVLVGPA